MDCPKCQAVEIRTDVPAFGKANVCQKCGWLEVTGVTLESGEVAQERIQQAEEPRQIPPSSTDRRSYGCVLCGKSRDQVKKLILGVTGGICTDCVELCRELLRQRS